MIADFYERFLSAVQGKEDDIKTVLIDSGGGPVFEGMKLGEWMFDHGVDVVVENRCISSCANYVFTAGRNKTIEADSIVGWHGSSATDDIVARALGMPSREYILMTCEQGFQPPGPVLTESELEECVQDTLKAAPIWQRMELILLNRLGVNDEALLYGILPDQFEEYDSSGAASWTLSIEDMATFGINNVTYAGEGEYPSEQAIKKHNALLFEVP